MGVMFPSPHKSIVAAHWDGFSTFSCLISSSIERLDLLNEQLLEADRDEADI
jgi:hypothetical protein